MNRNTPNSTQPPTGEKLALLYRRTLTERFSENNNLQGTFAFISNPLPFIRFTIPWLKTFGLRSFLICLAKLATGKRTLYIWHLNKDLAHLGWLNFGFCKHYPVEKSDVVIGPIWTAKQHRGRGLATESMKRALNICFSLESTTFLIDTTDNNKACQKVIKNTDFPAPESMFTILDNGTWIKITPPPNLQKP